ncbi:hypothetical protein [Mycolicibacterium aichiense]|uniref:Papain-like cysteine protease AvrRpt2 n=1 Tax=Mycolicibacterium aichiense TaxID=1799 RepID=A0AAD1MF56_9MYCO|nr:hypothetical protein [Mycolicibacterium aichiense]MCV7017264.1 hypothetical protein [Mycolicibacterium aichiense]BBX10305.1 hypothetical protein MAIC_51080 [Mycolicibacterium aichiense]STZ26035.1 Papain-like cysteine protease AvrRpt2 [Mycolicibacterium aichiense]
MAEFRDAVNRCEGGSKPRTPSPRIWLGAGAMTLGVGAAILGGAATAAADTTAGHASSSSNSASSSAGSASSSSAAPSAKGSSSTKATSRRNHPSSTGSAAARPRKANPARDIDAAAAVSPATGQVRESSAATTVPAAVQSATASITEPAPTAARRALAAATPALPTPNQILRDLQQFVYNVQVTVTNQVNGIRESLQVLGSDLASSLGFSREVITLPLPFGNPTLNKQFFVPAQAYVTSSITTIAMAYAQLTGTAPNFDEFFDLAKITPSVASPGKMMYVGPSNFVQFADSFELLQDKNVRVIIRSYSTDQWSLAFNALANGLQDPTKVMIATINGPIDGRDTPNGKTVIVIGIDNADGTVTINDPTRADDGQALTMTTDEFKAAWGAWSYQLVTAQLASSPSTPPPPPSTTRVVWSLPTSQQFFGGLSQALINQLDVAQDNLANLSFDLARVLGVARPDVPPPPTPADNQYGNYAANFPFWTSQPYFYERGFKGTCTLMASAAAISQLKGITAPEDIRALAQQLVDRAIESPSGVYYGKKMYNPTVGGVSFRDAVTLLNENGVNADYTKYLKGQDEVAKQAMFTALQQGQAVIVAANADVMWNAYQRRYFNRSPANVEAATADHALLVISVDLSRNMIYVNDSSVQNGQGFPMPLDDFMKAWKTGGYEMITAELQST